MNNDQIAASRGTAIDIVGSVLGYIGAEAAVGWSIECLLWPQRFYSGFSTDHTLAVSFLSPMGGPMYKVIFEVLDSFFAQGLFGGPRVGHMLGTAFFRRSDWFYTIHDGGGDNTGNEPHSEPVRNFLWARALCHMPMPVPRCGGRDAVSPTSFEKDLATAPNSTKQRAQTFVSHLTLSRPSFDDIVSPSISLVSEGTGTPEPHVFLAILTSESTGVLTAIAVVLAYRSLWAVLWVLPLLLRLTSALFALDREPLLDTSLSVDEEPRDFEIHCPESQGGFILVTGPPTLVLQFFRHYGHPIRNRHREVVQLLAVIALGCFFPAGLLSFIVWMPVHIQYVWICYQLYVVSAMCIARYSSARNATTTESCISEALSCRNASAGVDFASGVAPRDRAMLFGPSRDGEGTIKASATTTYHGSYGEGKDCMQRLLRRHDGLRRGAYD